MTQWIHRVLKEESFLENLNQIKGLFFPLKIWLTKEGKFVDCRQFLKHNVFE